LPAELGVPDVSPTRLVEDE